MPKTNPAKHLPSAAELAAIQNLALLKRSQLAAALGYSARTIDNLVARRAIPSINVGKRNVRFVLADVLSALNRFTVEAVR